MAILIKEGVRIRGLQPEMLLALVILEHEFASLGHPLVVTAALDGEHMHGSLHYRGLAVDIRSRMLQSEQQLAFITAAKAGLGECYDVVLEKDHFHIELSPIGLAKPPKSVVP